MFMLSRGLDANKLVGGFIANNFSNGLRCYPVNGWIAETMVWMQWGQVVEDGLLRKDIGVSPATWQRLVSANRVPDPIRLGGCVLRSRADLERWLDAGAPPARGTRTRAAAGAAVDQPRGLV